MKFNKKTQFISFIIPGLEHFDLTAELLYCFVISCILQTEEKTVPVAKVIEKLFILYLCIKVRHL